MALLAIVGMWFFFAELVLNYIVFFGQTQTDNINITMALALFLISLVLVIICLAIPSKKTKIIFSVLLAVTVAASFILGGRFIRLGDKAFFWLNADHFMQQARSNTTQALVLYERASPPFRKLIVHSKSPLESTKTISAQALSGLDEPLRFLLAECDTQVIKLREYYYLLECSCG
jgi:hypothetical protein